VTAEEVWGAALSLAAGPAVPACRVRSADGRSRRLRLERFVGDATAADRAVLARAEGPVLDVGCGPGRMVAALARAGVPAAGVDVSRTAVGLTRARGGEAWCRSVFAPLSGEGAWRTVLLLDGNVGIGGDPVRLLRRCAALIAEGGRVIAETGAPGTGRGTARVRLEMAGLVSDWFAWGRVGAGSIGALAAAAGLLVEERFAVDGRWFACLR
jgi:SAM-dependent methyltransferase